MARLYTRSGDAGTSRLPDGTAVAKSHWRLEVCGELDELSAQIGTARASAPDAQMNGFLATVQGLLLRISAQFADPLRLESGVSEADLRGVEAEIDRADGLCPRLRSFLLPAGCPSACAMHVARTVCRRVERVIVAGADDHGLPRNALPFVNRLSDLLFAYARLCNVLEGAREEEWQNGPEG